SGDSDFALQLGDPAATDTAGDLRFAARIVSANNGLLAEYNGIYAALTMIPGGSGRVYVIVGPSSPQDSGGLDLVLLPPGSISTSVSTDSSSSSSSSNSSDTPNPVQTPEVTGPSTTTSVTGGCVVTAGPSGVNVRGGDGTNFAPVG